MTKTTSTSDSINTKNPPETVRHRRKASPPKKTANREVPATLEEPQGWPWVTSRASEPDCIHDDDALRWSWDAMQESGGWR